MLLSFKGRSLIQRQKVKVYYNQYLKLFTIQDFETGLVVAHGNNIMMSECYLKVSKAGRKKALTENRNNIHSYIVGTYEGVNKQIPLTMREAYYNPHVTTHYIDTLTGRELHFATLVYLRGRQVGYL